MKIVSGILFITLLLFSFSLFGQQEGNSILESKISIHVTDQAVFEVLDSVSTEINMFFSYDPVQVGANRKVDLSVTEYPLKEVLDILLGEGYVYDVLHDQVIIKAKEESDSQTIDDTGPENEFLVLSGRVKDLSNRKPISFASISVEGKPVGTITNDNGEFELKLPVSEKEETILISCMGYHRQLVPIKEFEKGNIFLRPAIVKIREVKIKAISVEEILQLLLENVQSNYPNKSYLMTSFYRETLMQNKQYVNVAEAVMQILKSCYNRPFQEDKIKLLRGRKYPFKGMLRWVDMKIMGGPYYMIQLDAMKTLDSFLDKEYMMLYKYELTDVVLLNSRPTYIVRFKPVAGSSFASYRGHLYIDRESHALVRAQFELSKSGLKYANKVLIKRKPRGFNVVPLNVRYQVNYKLNNDKWFFHTSRASVDFRVKNKEMKINSIFESISDLLISDYYEADVRRFKASETFRSNDIFIDKITDYDENFWGNYNIIKPTESLQNAFKKISELNIKNLEQTKDSTTIILPVHEKVNPY